MIEYDENGICRDDAYGLRLSLYRAMLRVLISEIEEKIPLIDIDKVPMVRLR